jgi:hypothetical protein
MIDLVCGAHVVPLHLKQTRERNVAPRNQAVSADGIAPTVKLLGMTIDHLRNNPRLIPRFESVSGAV